MELAILRSLNKGPDGAPHGVPTTKRLVHVTTCPVVNALQSMNVRMYEVRRL